MVFSSFNSYAQDDNKLYKNYESRLNAINFSNNPNSKTVSVNWNSFYLKMQKGMDMLREDIINNPNKYPLQELEDENKDEPIIFRKWEYQMRRMPAIAVKPQQNILKVSYVVPESVTFCTNNDFVAKITIKNVTDFDLPDFYFYLTPIPGITINKSIKPKNINYVKRGNTFTFSQGLKKNKMVTIILQGQIGCDGQGGSPVLKGRDSIDAIFNWKLNLMGYLLDYDNRVLYKVIDEGKTPKSILMLKKELKTT
jgi:hypothetical protein